ncbi:MAG: rRNA maturation RNase YbeY, partial [Patescibacteria group bacterium]
MIEVTNLTKQKVDSGLVVKTAEKVLRGENSLSWDISIVFVGCAKIKELNKKFRKINKPTDVLSFSGLENKSG